MSNLNSKTLRVLAIIIVYCSLAYPLGPQDQRTAPKGRALDAADENHDRLAVLNRFLDRMYLNDMPPFDRGSLEMSVQTMRKNLDLAPISLSFVIRMRYCASAGNLEPTQSPQLRPLCGSVEWTQQQLLFDATVSFSRKSRLYVSRFYVKDSTLPGAKEQSRFPGNNKESTSQSALLSRIPFKEIESMTGCKLRTVPSESRSSRLTLVFEGRSILDRVCSASFDTASGHLLRLE